MPIPTRRLSLREPRIAQQRKPPDLDREVTIPEVESPRSIKPRSNTISTTTTTSTAGLTSAPSRNSNLPSHNQPMSISGLPQPATTAAPTNSGGNGGNGDDRAIPSRRRSFLPQRSTWQRGGGGMVPSGRSQLQMEDNTLLIRPRIQEAQTPAPQSPVSAPPAETSAPVPDLPQPIPPLSPSKLSRPVASLTRTQAVGVSRLERPGSANAPKSDTLNCVDGPTSRTRLERAGSSSTTSSQLSRPQSVHMAAKVENPGSSSTITSQGSRTQNKSTQRLERPERLGSGNTPIPEARKPQTASVTRLERSASLRQPIASTRVTTTANHSRHQSQVVGSTKGHTGAKQGEGNISLTPSLKASKPQFSTFQQHYSPKKGPKTKPPIPPASTSSTVTTLGARAGIESSSQTHPHVAALQIELLQLHLLHTDSIRAKRDWEYNVEEQLGKQYKTVVAKYHTLLAQEQAAQRYTNNQALSKLAADSKPNTNKSNTNDHNGAYDFSEQIQVLSRVIQDVATLTDMRGGRYISCVRTFGKWFEHVARVRQGRAGSRNRLRPQESAVTVSKRNGSGDDDDDCNYDTDRNGDNEQDASSHKYEFIDPLSFKWKEEVTALAMKLELCARELDCLDVDMGMAGGEETSVDLDTGGQSGDGYPPSSALVRVVKGHKMLLASMIEELEVMSAVEADVGELERLWVREAVDRLGSGGTAAFAGGEREERRPAWAVG
ncbi:conserved hypothetical protein [Histoplasma capsulatum G186AR]|uniref:Uncharacterized protein n=2 Tax=Ajellomyces capsulatus TaxID=5037 RepID=C0NC12_AJECG|nr:uncharacterized protein HCBG_00658 [Histoplasma capsulatum G186AR]EEH11203.1 conserved hypothetical protein [Histoplasma capsulatum G186AR]